MNTALKKYHLKRAQIELGLKTHVLLRPVITRWLSMGPAINRLLENWDTIENTLNILPKRVRNRETLATITQRFRDPMSKVFFYFMLMMFQVYEDVNKTFQTESVIIADLYYHVSELYLSILRRFLPHDYVNNTEILQINYNDLNYQLPDDQLDIGYMTRAELQLNPMIDENRKRYFLLGCRYFYMGCANEVKVRLIEPFQHFKILEFLLPPNACDPEYLQENQNLFLHLSEQFPRAFLDPTLEYNFAIDQLHYEYSLIPEIVQHPNFNAKTDQFWSEEIYNRRENDVYISRNIGRLALNFCSIPHSNAEPERRWSQKNSKKNKKRNRLKCRMTNALMRLSDFVKFSRHFPKIVPSEAMIRELMREVENADDDDSDNDSLVDEDLSDESFDNESFDDESSTDEGSEDNDLHMDEDEEDMNN